jgi:hypothetical protein
MSWCGAAHRSCSMCLSLSSYLLIVLALAELALGIAIFTQGDTIDRFLRDHQQELHLTYAAASSLLCSRWGSSLTPLHTADAATPSCASSRTTSSCQRTR